MSLLAPTNSTKILGVGNPFFDRIVHVDFLHNDLKKGVGTVVLEKKIAEQFWEKAYGTGPYSWSLGGSGTNVIKALSRLLSCLDLMYSCSLLGMVGKDKKEELTENLKNINITSLLIEGKDDNGIVNCFVTPDSERTMQTFFGACLEFSSENILPDHFLNVSHVHLEGYLAYFNGTLEKSIKLAKENGAKISLDLSSIDVIAKFNNELKACAAKIDIIFGNIQEMSAFTGCEDVSEMIKRFQPKQIIVITDGGQGCWVKPTDESTAYKFDALPVESNKIIDTTGAGDFFAAGFLSGILGKKDIKTCIKIGNLAASSVIQQDGTDLPCEKWKELKEKISEFK